MASFIDILPLDLRKELEKYLFPYTVHVKRLAAGWDVVQLIFHDGREIRMDHHDVFRYGYTMSMFREAVNRKRNAYYSLNKCRAFRCYQGVVTLDGQIIPWSDRLGSALER